jgi:CRISPR-associated protein (TIGR03984 family)
MKAMSDKVRAIKNGPALVETSFPVELLNDGAQQATEWFTEQAAALAKIIGTADWYLLAHADDGVIWGKVAGGNLTMSDRAIGDKHATLSPNDTARTEVEAALKTCAPLRRETLQQARLFCEKGELLVWRDGDNRFHARLLRDAQHGEASLWDEHFDEPQMLWGSSNHDTPLPHDFTLWSDGAQGLRHAMPLPPAIDAQGNAAPPRLVVRHYISMKGFARVEASRLVGFEK